MNRAIRLKFGTDIEDGTSCMWTLKRHQSGRGLGHVTQFRNFGTTYNFGTNGGIRFKFDTDIQDGPLLRVDHKTTPYGRWLGHVTQFLKFGPLITFE